MRIVLCTRFYKNGQTTHVTDLCAELMRQGHQILLIITHLHDPEYSRWLRKMRIPYVTTSNPAKLKKYIAGKWLAYPDVIHNHSSHTIQLATALSTMLQIPIVTTIHYLDFECADLLAKQNAVILISQEMQVTFEHLKTSTYLVQNGIPIPELYPKTRPWGKQALLLARVTADKERNFCYMAESLLAWGWKVRSAGNWRHQGVSFHGWVNQVSSLLKEADLVVGTGRAVREAMAWGIPAWVLGVYSDGLVTPKNVTRLEKTNFSGRSSKKPLSLSEVALHLREPSLETLQKLGDFGRKHALEHYSIQSMTEKIVAIYNSCNVKYSSEKQT